MKNWRTNFVFLLILLFAAALISRLIFLQVLNREYWGALAKGQQKTFQEIPAQRGEVFLTDKDNNLYPLAVNKNFSFVYLSPNEIEEKEDTAKALSPVLSLKEDFILSKAENNNFYELIKEKLTEEEIRGVNDLDLKGIYVSKESLRYYPQQSLASHAIGFLSKDGIGQYGIEGYHHDVLEGEQGFREGERTIQGFFLAFTEKLFPAKQGSDLILTLDYNLQFNAEKLLKKAKDDLNIEEGTIIVIDPYSGEILALANFPNFNPNQYTKEEDFEIFQNGAIQKIFEPGSVFKAITMASALDKGKITPDTMYEDLGYLNIGGYTIYNYDERIWGGRTMTEVLEKSINTGAIFAERQLGHNSFLEYIRKFGIFEKTGIDLDGEVYSINSNLKEGYEINFATASFGQGIEMTPIQLIRGFSVIANGGSLINPHIVKKAITDGKEKEIKQKAPEKIISPKTVSQITSMLVSVVENGYAKAAKVPGYFIAGKTGTAQIPWGALGVNKSGYSDQTIQTFIGFGPAFDPRFFNHGKAYQS